MYLVRRESNDGKLLYNSNALITGTFNTKGLILSTLHDYLTTLQRMLAFNYTRKYDTVAIPFPINIQCTLTKKTLVHI